MSRPSLTRRQLDIYNYIVDYTEARGWAPSMREIRDACDFRSLSSIAWQLTQLEMKGYILRHPNIPRAMRVVGE